MFRTPLMIIEPGLQLWGSERALAATLKPLTEVWSKVVLVLPPGAKLAEEIANAPHRYGPVEIVSAPIGLLHQRGRLARLQAAAALAVLIMRLRPGRIYVNQAGLASITLPSARLLSVPVAVHVRILEDVKRAITLKSTERTPLDLIFVSESMAASIGETPLPTHTKIFTAYDPYLLTLEPVSLPKEAPFVFVGRLSESKGPHLLVDALGTSDLADASADIYGTGVEGDEYAAHLWDSATKTCAPVRFMGFWRNVIQRLPAYQFLILTSKYEPLGRVVMEAWEAGLVPIVFGDSGGAAEMIRKSRAGLIYDDWSAEEVARVMAEALQMTEYQRQAMVTAGRNWMAQELGIEAYKIALRGLLF